VTCVLAPHRASANTVRAAGKGRAPGIDRYGVTEAKLVTLRLAAVEVALAGRHVAVPISPQGPGGRSADARDETGALAAIGHTRMVQRQDDALPRSSSAVTGRASKRALKLRSGSAVGTVEPPSDVQLLSSIGQRLDAESGRASAPIQFGGFLVAYSYRAQSAERGSQFVGSLVSADNAVIGRASHSR
jgi:hypothetical protein